MKYLSILALTAAAFVGGWLADREVNPRYTLVMESGGVISHARAAPWHGSLLSAAPNAYGISIDNVVLPRDQISK